MDIQKQIEEARNTLYRIDGPFASPEGMVIENALTAIEEFISQQSAEISNLKRVISEQTKHYSKCSNELSSALAEIEQLETAIKTEQDANYAAIARVHELEDKITQ